MAEACTLPRAPAAAAELGPFDRTALDLGYCNRVEFVIALNEFERQRANVGHRYETWPDDVRRLMEAELGAWRQRNPDREIVGMTSGVTPKHVCILIVHHRAKA